MSEELKPCPWPDCGKNEATLDSVVARDLYELWAVTCPHCERSVEGKDGSLQGAIDAWNALARAALAAPSDREKRLEEVLLEIAAHGRDKFDRDIARAALADTTTDEVQP